MSDLPNDMKLNEADQKELQTFMNQQQSQARMQSSVHTFTSMCWDKCITSTPSTSFSRSEQGCLANCVDRFLDTSLFMVRKIEQERMNAGVSMSS